MKKILKPFICIFLSTLMLFMTVNAHPGRTDSKGGHTVNVEGWGYAVGTYHYHDKKYEQIVPVDKESGTPLGIVVLVNGEPVTFDQSPVIIDGRTLVPIRAVVEKLGYEVRWNDVTKTVYVKTKKIADMSFPGTNIKVSIDNELIVFDVPPQIINGRTLIPIRAVAEKLGYEVDWDGDLKVVYIDEKD